ncbi:hypothetical protein BpHYR1_023609 [Brachionus plicatilis]|uniref:Uncharacterized protein n=1 Tax=Brachionus plicatilis TaxID=10195 RepID=A0A3M7Q0Z5_BRAPC|nr:hypothetical protein BpHYR1_023609 [Brachionus plicatilis]
MILYLFSTFSELEILHFLHFFYDFTHNNMISFFQKVQHYPFYGSNCDHKLQFSNISRVNMQVLLSHVDSAPSGSKKQILKTINNFVKYISDLCKS